MYINIEAEEKMKKSAILFIMLTIAFTGLPIVSADTQYPSNYTISVTSGQNTVLTTINTSFGTVLAGDTGEIIPTFNLTNSGNVRANVSAAFITNVSGTFGMTNSTDIIPASALSLKKQGGTYTYLSSAGTDVQMADKIAESTPPTPTIDNWDIKIEIPSGQVSKLYSGTIQLTFTDDTTF